MFVRKDDFSYKGYHEIFELIIGIPFRENILKNHLITIRIDHFYQSLRLIYLDANFQIVSREMIEHKFKGCSC